jgi:UDP-MurNAc hydroxylase
MITFLNHASFIIDNGKKKLLCDPYLFGCAFNEGWNLITEEKFKNIEDIDYIWFSHEHPDHFSIPFLKSIPASIRNNITVLFQKTYDKKVLKFCVGLGFKVHELPNHSEVELCEDFKIKIGTFPLYDSWALFTVCGKKILNTNDCVFETTENLKSVSNHVSKCDILFTQFSYAGWIDSKEKVQSRIECARKQLRNIQIQSEEFKPSYIVPFASFVYFSHQENNYMNSEINTPKAAVEFIQKECEGKPILLKPNEKWDGNSSKDNSFSLNYWETKYLESGARKLNQSAKSFSIETLNSKSKGAVERIKQKNSYFMLLLFQMVGLIKPVVFYLTDQNQYVSFDWERGLIVRKGVLSKNIISLHSESLGFIFDYDYGQDTLKVNARFESTFEGKKALTRLFSVLSLNNTGRFISLGGMTRILNFEIIQRALRIFLRR